VTSVTDTARRFLEDAPPQIRDVLDWYGDGDAKEAPARDISDFAGKFLGALYEDGAKVPPPIELADRLRRFFWIDRRRGQAKCVTVGL
jgi:hypothetical protein